MVVIIYNCDTPVLFKMNKFKWSMAASASLESIGSEVDLHANGVPVLIIHFINAGVQRNVSNISMMCRSIPSRIPSPRGYAYTTSEGKYEVSSGVVSRFLAEREGMMRRDPPPPDWVRFNINTMVALEYTYDVADDGHGAKQKTVYLITATA